MAGPNAGRRGSRWRTLTAQVKARRESCCRCGQPINYGIRWPDPQSFSVDHYPHPLGTHPHLAEDPTNLHAAHLRCNQSAGDKGPTLTAGSTSEAW
jgi:5-methylcytosine-specific restriction endonuclease McrA